MLLRIALAATLAIAGCQAATVEQLDAVGPPPATIVVSPAPVAVESVQVESPTVPAVVELEPEPPEPVQPERVRRVALLLPLSGRNTDVGVTLLNAAQLALFETAEDDLDLLVLDTRGTPDGAAEAARAAVDGEAGLILGPFFGASADAVRPVAAAASVNVVSFSNNREIAGDGTFVFGFLPDQQVRRITAFAASRGYKEFAMLVPSTGFGDLVVEAARAAVEQQGRSLARVTYFDPAKTDLSQVIRRFANYDLRKAALNAQRNALTGRTDPVSQRALRRLANRETLGKLPFDSVIIPFGGAELRRIASLLAFYDVDPVRVKLLGTALWDETGLGTEPSLLGGWYAAPSPVVRLAFEDKYHQAFGVKPPRLATLGYDAMLLAVALSYLEDGPDYSIDALTDSRGFAGVDGIFRLLADGTNQRGLAILEIQPDLTWVIDPAAEMFPDTGS